MHFKRLTFLIVSLAIVLLSNSTALAADFKTPDESDNLVITKGEPTKNLFAFGNSVKILSDIKGDLFIFGNIISIDSNVENDLFVCGNIVTVNGKVGGNLFAFCSTLQINGNVYGDTYCFSSAITLSKAGSIKDDLFISGGTAQLYGNVGRNVALRCGDVSFEGEVTGSVKAKATNIKVGSVATIKGDLIYESRKEAIIEEGAKIYGKKEFNRIEPKTRVPLEHQRRYFGWFFWLRIIICIVTGLVFAYLFGNFTRPVVKESLYKFWSSLGIGFAGLILMPVAILIILITIIGVALAGIFASLYILMLCISIALAGIVCGSLLLKLITRDTGYPLNWLSVILGVVVLSFVRLIPFIGWIPCFVFLLIGLGAIFKLIFKFISEKKA